MSSSRLPELLATNGGELESFTLPPYLLGVPASLDRPSDSHSASAETSLVESHPVTEKPSEAILSAALMAWLGRPPEKR